MLIKTHTPGTPDSMGSARNSLGAKSKLSKIWLDGANIASLAGSLRHSPS